MSFSQISLHFVSSQWTMTIKVEKIQKPNAKKCHVSKKIIKEKKSYFIRWHGFWMQQRLQCQGCFSFTRDPDSIPINAGSIAESKKRGE